MSRSYDVEIFDIEGRWLAQDTFSGRPTREQIEQAFPVLARGRHEVRVCQGNGGGILSAWRQGEGRGVADLDIEEARRQAKPVRKPARAARRSR